MTIRLLFGPNKSETIVTKFHENVQLRLTYVNKVEKWVTANEFVVGMDAPRVERDHHDTDQWNDQYGDPDSSAGIQPWLKQDYTFFRLLILNLKKLNVRFVDERKSKDHK
jgi:hypothetical protein